VLNIQCQKDLVDNGVLKKVGAGPKTSYQLNKDILSKWNNISRNLPGDNGKDSFKPNV